MRYNFRKQQEFRNKISEMINNPGNRMKRSSKTDMYFWPWQSNNRKLPECFSTSDNMEYDHSEKGNME